MKSHINYITINDDYLIRVDISLKLKGANIKQEQCINNDIPKFKHDSKIQVPKCTVLLFKTTNNTPSPISILTLFINVVVQNINQYKRKTELYVNNTGHSIIDLQLLFSRLSIYHKGTLYMGIRIFNSLPFDIPACTNNVKQFKRALICFFLIILFITGIF